MLLLELRGDPRTCFRLAAFPIRRISTPMTRLVFAHRIRAHIWTEVSDPSRCLLRRWLVAGDNGAPPDASGKALRNSTRPGPLNQRHSLTGCGKTRIRSSLRAPRLGARSWKKVPERGLSALRDEGTLRHPWF